MKTDAKIAELEKQICELEARFEEETGEIENVLRKSGVRNVDPVCIIENAAEMVDIQRRLFALENKHAAMMRSEEISEVTG